MTKPGWGTGLRVYCGVAYPVDDVGIVARAGRIRHFIDPPDRYAKVWPWLREGIVRFFNRSSGITGKVA